MRKARRIGIVACYIALLTSCVTVRYVQTSAIESMGGHHKTCAVDMIHFDEKNKVVTTPAYMLGPGIKDVAQGIQKLVDKVLELASS